MKQAVETKGCGDKDCKPAAQIRAEPISRMTTNLLDKLKIRCMDCKEGSETIPYSAYNAHQISHHYCLYCSKSLNDWTAIREHYYEKCLKYQVDCTGCEFVFDCEDYVHHSCSLHYDYRIFELILVLANAFM